MPPFNIEDAAYPKYGPFGQSTPRTLGQLQQDTFAKQALEESYAPSFAAIEAEAGRRGDPMQKSIEGRIKALQYERTLPAGSRGRIGATFGGDGPLAGMEVGSEAVGERNLGIPTIEEAIRQGSDERLAQIRSQAAADDIANAQNTQRRGDIADSLMELRAGLEEKVRSGQLPQIEAEARFKEALRRVQPVSDILKTGFPPVSRDPFQNDDTFNSQPSPAPSPRGRY